MATAREVSAQVLANAQHLSEEPEGLFLPDIAKLIPSTIREIALDIIENGKPDERALFTKTITPTIVSVSNNFDTVDLAAALSDTEPIFLDVPFPSVAHASSQSGELLRVSDFANLKFANLAESMDWYAIDGVTLYINAEPELTGNLTIRAYFVPTVVNLKKQFESELISRLLVKIGLSR